MVVCQVTGMLRVHYNPGGIQICTNDAKLNHDQKHRCVRHILFLMDILFESFSGTSSS